MQAVAMYVLVRLYEGEQDYNNMDVLLVHTMNVSVSQACLQVSLGRLVATTCRNQLIDCIIGRGDSALDPKQHPLGLCGLQPRTAAYLGELDISRVKQEVRTTQSLDQTVCCHQKSIIADRATGCRQSIV
jgi:hypothetical protein